jgi:hypothetical protein
MLHGTSTWWWRQYAPLKRRSTSTWLHSAASLKTKLHTRRRENLKSHFVVFPPHFVCMHHGLWSLLRGCFALGSVLFSLWESWRCCACYTYFIHLCGILWATYFNQCKYNRIPVCWPVCTDLVFLGERILCTPTPYAHLGIPWAPFDLPVDTCSVMYADMNCLVFYLSTNHAGLR